MSLTARNNPDSPRVVDTVLTRELLYRMKRIRMVEETIAERYHEGKMRCPTHLSIGQEAVSAAVGMALRVDDFAVSGHRAHGHYLGKGGDLKKMIAEIYGKATGCSRGKGGSMHLIDRDVGFMGSTAIVASTIPVGVGLGLSARLQGSDQISTVFFGDGAVEEGVFFESANFAALKQLPVLFVCENNYYSVYSPMRVRQPPGRSIHAMVGALGVPSESGDGNDVVDVYTRVRATVEEIRNGGGPRFFEFFTYRWREHCGPNFDNDIGYRSKDEFMSWKSKDPIMRLEGQLVGMGVLGEEDIGRMEADIKKEVEQAFAFAESSPFPSADETFTHLYKD
jgi:TPP-dependent pyruvate/acetoin dehydrogenase alpha subunit